MNRLCCIALSVAAILTAAPGASAYQLAVQSTQEERRLAGLSPQASLWSWSEQRLARFGVSAFAEPVHEEITNRIFGCDGDVCAGDGPLAAPPAVLFGVRWNDDPPFRLGQGQAAGTSCKAGTTVRFETQPLCWVSLFNDASAHAATGRSFGQGDALLYRSHFGDLQFIHAMAAEDGEQASITQRKILDWAEFTWRISLGEYSLDTVLKDVPIGAVRESFSRSDWRVQDLFTLGAGNGPRLAIKDVAFGSLLHVLQDSYSQSHVSRQEASGSGNRLCALGSVSVDSPGRIRSFHSYKRQDHKLHGEADTRRAFMAALQQAGDVVEVGRPLRRAKERNASWEEVRPYLECVFGLVDPSAPAGPGDYKLSEE